MAVGFRSSSSTGASDDYVSVINVPVPSGAQAGDIALVGIGMWEGSDPTVMPPVGFTQIAQAVSAENKMKVFWKRLSTSESGSWGFSWSGSQWSLAHALLLTDGKISGDPIEDFDAVTGSGTSYPPASVTTATEPFLAMFVYNGTSGAGTPPTGFTEVQDSSYEKTSYRIPGSTGTFSASGGTLPDGTNCAILVAVAAEGGGAPAPKTDAFFSFFE